MGAAFYFALTDENGVLCVDQLDDTHAGRRLVEDVAGLAATFPSVIYFYVDNRVPEFRAT